MTNYWKYVQLYISAFIYLIISFLTYLYIVDINEMMLLATISKSISDHTS